MLDFLLNLSRRSKRAIFLSVDILLVLVSLYVAFTLRFGTAFPFSQMKDSLVLFPFMLAVSVPVFLYTQLPNIKLNAIENKALIRVGVASIGLMVLAIIGSYMMNLNAPRSVPLILGVSFFCLASASRLVGNALLHNIDHSNARSLPVAIYGAGAAGIQLASALRASSEVHPVVFIDDNPNLHGVLVAGLKVLPPSRLPDLATKAQIKRVLIAIPSASQNLRNALVDKLRSLNLEIQILPSYVDLVSDPNPAAKLRTVSPDELLGRDNVDLNIPDIAKAYAGRTIIVTGAGGSIGSELCRQLLDCGPSKIVLFEQSEFALYEIERTLRPMAERSGIKVVARLGSVTNRTRIETVMRQEEVEIVLHAAAYKHVPLVEENEIEGGLNNVIGTQVVAETAISLGLERFILVSTDKAVRPTNIMGATKRMAELVVQDLQKRSMGTRLSMVRFGNVLGSSGSVLPLFQQQIAMGGPLTVTHPDITRFFMTIPEAARLVLLAGAFSNGRDIFVLNMGKPARIIDIAKRMINLSGRSVRDESNPDGDIAIEITGLRPGEKLYEELLIADDSLRATPHPKILRAEENSLSEIEVAGMLKDLQKAVEAGDTEAIRNVVEYRVEGYHRQEVVA